MDRQSAIDVLKVILDRCEGLDNSQITLTPPKAEDILSEGFQIHIKGPNLHEETLRCLEDIFIQRKLKILQEGSILIIYEPRKKA